MYNPRVPPYLNQILLGDCLDVLKLLPDDSVDACVSDVPYGLGIKEPTPEQILNYLNGEDLITGDFMGADWNVPSVKVWREIFRVLKPGGYVLAFGGTRTFDLISMGLRFAGFTNRDTIGVNSAGEPVEEELPVLQWTYGSGMPKSTNVGKTVEKKFGPDAEISKKTAGTGTALKPSWEPILVFRKPFKGTLVDNVLAHGTGGINIDGCRVKHSSAADFEAHKKGVDAVRERGGVREDSWKNSSDLSGANEVTAAGRWPANMLLVHSGGCSDEGCVEGCPVRALDLQSGDRPSTLTGRADPNVSHGHPGTEFNANSTFLGERTHHSNVYADSGGASRFFQQFDGVPFRYIAKANRKKASCGEFKVMHPTLKPYELLQYLVRLVTPKGGTVLDPYCGSGSTCHAAILEGFNYIGIEKDGPNHEEAVRRIQAVYNFKNRGEAPDSNDIFDFIFGDVPDEEPAELE